MENCIFCKIAQGEIPSYTVYEDKDFRAILDIAPANQGHVLILPKHHYSDLLDIDNELSSKAFALTKKLAFAVKSSFNCDGINILQNNGEAAGQTVFHFHIHIIPRWKEDNIPLSWIQGSPSQEELLETADIIKAHLI